MGETKQFSKRIQDILDGLELRTGKKKVQTKEDLKKCFKKICLNAYSAEENGQPRLYDYSAAAKPPVRKNGNHLSG